MAPNSNDNTGSPVTDKNQKRPQSNPDYSDSDRERKKQRQGDDTYPGWFVEHEDVWYMRCTGYPCPFYMCDPLRYWKCADLDHPHPNDVVRHIEQHHLLQIPKPGIESKKGLQAPSQQDSTSPFYCRVCRLQFFGDKAEAQQNKHSSRPCTQQTTIERAGVLLPEEFDKINTIENSRIANFSKWDSIWQLCFPNRPWPPPSKWIALVCQQPELATRVFYRDAENIIRDSIKSHLYENIDISSDTIERIVGCTLHRLYSVTPTGAWATTGVDLESQHQMPQQQSQQSQLPQLPPQPSDSLYHPRVSFPAPQPYQQMPGQPYSAVPTRGTLEVTPQAAVSGHSQMQNMSGLSQPTFSREDYGIFAHNSPAPGTTNFSAPNDNGMGFPTSIVPSVPTLGGNLNMNDLPNSSLNSSLVTGEASNTTDKDGEMVPGSLAPEDVDSHMVDYNMADIHKSGTNDLPFEFR